MSKLPYNVIIEIFRFNSFQENLKCNQFVNKLLRAQVVSDDEFAFRYMHELFIRESAKVIKCSRGISITPSLSVINGRIFCGKINEDNITKIDGKVRQNRTLFEPIFDRLNKEFKSIGYEYEFNMDAARPYYWTRHFYFQKEIVELCLEHKIFDVTFDIFAWAINFIDIAINVADGEMSLIFNNGEQSNQFINFLLFNDVAKIQFNKIKRLNKSFKKSKTIRKMIKRSIGQKKVDWLLMV